ncbi:MAG: translation initiation factor 2, partial [Acidimicrobiia bacterium]
GDLTRIKAELVRALMGYYHARVPYPGFPGPKVAAPVDGATTAALPSSATSIPPVDPPNDEAAPPDAATAEGDG